MQTDKSHEESPDALLPNLIIILLKVLRQYVPKITPEFCSSSKDKQQDLLLPENKANAWTLSGHFSLDIEFGRASNFVHSWTSQWE